MRTSISLVGLGIVAGGTLQLGFLLNSGVVHGAYLTSLGVLVGIVLGVAVYLYKKWRNYRSMYVIEGCFENRPWYKGLFNTELVVFFCIMFSMAALTLANNTVKVFEPYTENFTVTSVSSRVVRYQLYEYVKITNGSVTVKYMTNGNQYTKDQEVTAVLRKGLLGFPVVIELLPVNGS